MRTTITVDDEIFRAFKVRAAQDGTTFSRVVEQALRAWLLQEHQEEPFRLITGGQGGIREGVDINSNAALGIVLDEEHPMRAW
jgi:plasmid stability protein